MITKIKVTNFKSLENFDLDLLDFNVIVGHNGAGKSNLLKAVKLLSELAKGEKIRNALSEMLISPSEVFFDPTQKTFSIEIQVKIQGRFFNYLLKIGQIGHEIGSDYKIIQEVLKNGDEKPLLERTGENIQVKAQNSDEVTNTRLVDDQIAVSLFKEPEEVVLVKKYLSNITVLNSDDLSIREQKILAKLDEGDSKRVKIADTLFDLKRNREAVYNEVIENFVKMVPAIKNVEVKRHEKVDSIVIQFTDSGSTEPYLSYSASDGDLRTLVMLTTIISLNKPALVLLDEVENSLHPTRIKSLLKLLEFLSEKENSEIQVIITTHSSYLLSKINAESIIYMYRIDGKSIASRLKDNTSFWDKVRKHSKEVDTGKLYESGILEEILTNQQ